MMDGVNYATSILIRAVTMDQGGRYTESLVCYQEGLQILMESLKSIKEEDKRLKLRSKIEEYMKRAEKLKNHIESLKSSGKYREQIQVLEDSIGNSYNSVFSRFMDHSVIQVEIDDPYIRMHHQCENFLRFVELCVRLCPNLKKLHLKTGKDTNSIEQEKKLSTIRNSLQKSKNIKLDVEFSDSIHDREIRIDNGWVIKIGRGLDYFKPEEKFNLGFSDFDLRHCKETTIDIFHKNEIMRCR